jgi:hypothetical protein
MTTYQQMTAKEALAALFQYYEQSFDWLYQSDLEQTAERCELRQQAYRALLRLTPVIHGKPPDDRSMFLCESCYLRYASRAEDGTFEDFCQPCREARAHAQPAQTPEAAP